MKFENKLIVIKFYIIIFFTINTKLNKFQNKIMIEIKYNIFLKINFIDSINVHDNKIIIQFININIDIKTLNDKNKI